MNIQPITLSDEDKIAQAAALLIEGFPLNTEWNTRPSAIAEVHEVLADGVAFAAVDHDGQMLGWVGALEVYHGFTWELHPIVVRADRRRGGVGRTLVLALEEAARAAGIVTMMLGTDDEDGRTTLSQIDDLYADIPSAIQHAASFDPANPHPMDFYRRLGYRIVGLLPDANGARKPDIFMAKRM